MVPSRLIVNADDFGLTQGINRAIAELHRAGAVSSATLMANGAAFAHAAELARAHPQLGVGCHIVLTDGVPVSPPERIRTLLDRDGLTFRSSLTDFLRDVLLGRVDAAEIEAEALAQIRVLQANGIQVTHVDTHKHTHVLPRVAKAVIAAAERAGVGAIRNPFEAPWSLRIGHTRPLRLLAVATTRLLERGFLAHPALRSGRVRTTQGTLGISATGHLDEAPLRQLLAAMPPGTWELVCHPGYNDRDLDAVTTRLRQTREVERNALLAVLGDPALSGLVPPISQELDSPAHPQRPPLIHYGRL